MFNSTATTIPTTPITSPTVQFIDQRERPDLRHRRGDPGSDHGRVPVRVPRREHDRTDPVAGPGGQQPQRPRLGGQLHRIEVAPAVLVLGQRRQLPPEGPLRRRLRRRRPRCQREDRQACLQAWARQPQRGLHRRHVQRADAPGHGIRQYGGLDGLSGRRRSGRRGRRQAYPQARGRAGRLLHADRAESAVRPGPRAGLPVLSGHPGLRPHQRGHHHVGLDRQRHGQRLAAELGDQDGLRLLGLRRGARGDAGASHIGHLKVNGSLVSSDISATFRPANAHYNRKTGTAGNGTIKGRVTGEALDTGGTTGLGNTGAGVFAKHLKGRLPAAQ